MTKVYDAEFRSEQKYWLGSENFSILDHVNVFLLFKNHVQGNKFNEFRLSHSNLIIFTLVQCFITGLTLLGNLMMDKHHPSIPSSVSLYFGTICPLFLGWFIIILQLSLPKMSTLSYKEFIKQRIIPMLQDIWCLFVSISLCLFTIATAYNGHCSHNEYGLKGFGCSHSSVSYMPDGLMLLSLLFPNIIFVLVQGAKWKYVLLSYVITIVFHVCTIGALQLVNSIPALVVFIFFTSLIMFENQRQNVHMFFMSERIDALAAENVRLLEEEHAVEMRHMIANVAHDLKTPLTAFTSGLENIYGLADEMEGGLNSPTGSNREQMGDIITNIKNNIGLIKNINSFMVMTINRCIDYTKATNNVKLVPRCETFDLKEAMDLPLRCNRDIQDKIVIKLQPIGTNISPQIITDKQWFQENILCLLSNAVKYSTSGSVVVITVTLVPASAGPDDNSKEKSGNDMSSRDPSSEDKFTSRLVFKPQPFDTKVPVIYSDLSKSNATEELSFQMRSPDLRLGARKQLATEDSFEHSTEPTERYSIKRHSNSAKKLTGEEPPSEDFRSVVPSSTDPPQLQPQPSISDLCKYEYSFSSAHSPQLRVEVEDTGIGMTDTAMETLFKPFKQAQRLAGGTGLGLYSLAKRVEALKGTYGVMNRRDGQQGSVFWFSIPYKPDKAKIRNLSISAKLSVNVSIGHNSKASMDPTYLTELSQSGSPSSMAASSLRITGGMQKLNILIVDDSLSILKMSSMLLRRQGHTITTAENGAEAVQKIFDQKRTKHTPYDVVLMDLQMPVMDGLEATRRLRQSEEKISGVLSTIASPQGSFRSVARSSDPYEIMEIVDANSSGHTRSSENKSFIRRKSTLPLSNSAGIAGTTLTKQSFTNSMNNSSNININSSSSGIPTSSEHRSTGNRGRTSSSGGSGVVSPGSPMQQSSALLSIGSTPRNSNPNNPNNASNASNAAAAAAERNRHMMSQQSLRAVTRAKEAEELKYDHMSQLVIGVSANSDAETVEEAFRAGVDAFIPKPFTLESFNKTYLNLLEMKMIDTMIENDVSNRENNKVDNKGLVKAVSEALMQQANTQQQQQQQQQSHQKENLLQDV